MARIEILGIQLHSRRRNVMGTCCYTYQWLVVYLSTCCQGLVIVMHRWSNSFSFFHFFLPPYSLFSFVFLEGLRGQGCIFEVIMQFYNFNKTLHLYLKNSNSNTKNYPAKIRPQRKKTKQKRNKKLEVRYFNQIGRASWRERVLAIV